MQLLFSQPLVLCAIVIFHSAVGQPAAAPMAAPMSAPGTPDDPIPSVKIHFDVVNLEYGAVAEHDDARDGIREAVKKAINHIAEEAIAGPAGAPGPAALAPAGPAFIEFSNSSGLHSKRHYLKVQSPGAAPSPAPMISPAMPMPDNVDTFVALEEGPGDCTEINVWTIDPKDRANAAEDAAPSPAGAASPAAFIDRGSHSLLGGPGFATEGMGKTLEKKMEQICDDKTFLANALLGAEGVHWKHAPEIKNCKVTVEPIVSFHLDCAPHVKQIINRFSVAYTRAQVPHALEEACHLFESKISFSGNRRITKWDKRICKTATEKLMNHWQPEVKLHGAQFRNKRVFKGPSVVNSGGGDENYDQWCTDICEWKFGKGAPQCRQH